MYLPKYMIKACQTDCNKNTKRHESSLGNSLNKKEPSKKEKQSMFIL